MLGHMHTGLNKAQVLLATVNEQISQPCIQSHSFSQIIPSLLQYFVHEPQFEVTYYKF